MICFIVTDLCSCKYFNELLVKELLYIVHTEINFTNYFLHRIFYTVECFIVGNSLFAFHLHVIKCVLHQISYVSLSFTIYV